MERDQQARELLENVQDRESLSPDFLFEAVCSQVFKLSL